VTITRWRLLFGLAALLLAGLLVSFSGLVSVAASSGHLPPVSWFLHWTLQNAVRTQSLGIEPPPDLDLDDRALVRRAAGHFASSCAPCHGGPEQVQNPVVLEMTPAPPSLAEKVPQWRARELFWIVKHGVKFSGMPAWPAPARDDEIWAMVAFLRALPDMDATRYRELTEGPETRPSHSVERSTALLLEGQDLEAKRAIATCARCHAWDGNGVGEEGAFPVIAGQSQTYLDATLRAYARGSRQSGIMQSAVSGHSDEALEMLAQRYARQLPSGTGSDSNTRSLALTGERIAREGIPDRGVPACEACHGRSSSARDPHIPNIDGQHAWYLSIQLELFKSGDRGGTAYAHIMAMIAEGLERGDIEAVSAHYQSAGSGQ
jgi:cytochrome c553